MELSGQSMAPGNFGPAVFSSVQTVNTSVRNAIRVPTHFQHNAQIKSSAFKFGGKSFAPHHLQPILPRPTTENKYVPLQEVSKQPAKPVESKVTSQKLFKLCQWLSINIYFL